MGTRAARLASLVAPDDGPAVRGQGRSAHDEVALSQLASDRQTNLPKHLWGFGILTTVSVVLHGRLRARGCASAHEGLVDQRLGLDFIKHV